MSFKELRRIKPEDVCRMPRGWKPSPPVQEVLLNTARESKGTCLKFVRVLLRPDLRGFYKAIVKELQISDRDLVRTLRVAKQLSRGDDKWREVEESLVGLLAYDWRKSPPARDARTAIAVLGNLKDSFPFDIVPLQTELLEIARHWAKNFRKPATRRKGRKLDEKKQQILAAMELLIKVCGETRDKASEGIAEFIRDANEKSPTAESIRRDYARYRSIAPCCLDCWVGALAPYLAATLQTPRVRHSIQPSANQARRQ